MKHFIGYLKETEGPQQSITNEVDIQSLRKVGELFNMDFSDFDKAYSLVKPKISYSKDKFQQLNELLKKHKLEQYASFTEVLLKKIEYDVIKLTERLSLHTEFYNESGADTGGVESLIKMFEYYIEYEKTSGYDMSLLKSRLTFSPVDIKPLHIKNGEIVHSLISAAFHSITGIEDAYKIKSDDWKGKIREEFINKRFEKERLEYSSALALTINNFCISSGLSSMAAKQVIQNKVAKLIVDLVSFAGYEALGTRPDYKDVVYWAKRSSIH